MSKIIFITCVALLCLAAPVTSSATESARRTIIYDGVATEVEGQPASVPATKSPDLWITLTDLKRATRFELKPKGVCRDELCFPIPKARRASFVAKLGSATWFNLSEFAKLVRQPAAYDLEQSAWFFGPRADEQNGYLTTLEAPDFRLPDMNGKFHALSDFRGKKVLLLTWASW